MGVARTVIAMIGKFCISASFAIIYVVSGEIFPTPVRYIIFILLVAAIRNELSELI